MPNEPALGVEAPGLEVRADLLRIRLRRDREAVPVAPQGVLEPTLAGRVPHRLATILAPARMLQDSGAGTAHLGPGQVAGGGDDVLGGQPRTGQASLQVTQVAPLPLDRPPVDGRRSSSSPSGPRRGGPKSPPQSFTATRANQRSQ